MHDLIINTVTMTSLDISSMVESRHDKVKQSIERLAGSGVIVQPPVGDEQATDAMGRQRETKVYVFEGEQGKRDSIIVVAQLSPEFTGRLVDRWQELEKLTVPRSFADTLQLAADQQREVERLGKEVADAQPAIHLHESLTKDESMTLRDWFKMMEQDLPSKAIQKHLRQWAEDNGYIYREFSTREWKPYHHAMDLFTVEPTLTPKGVVPLLVVTGQGVRLLTWQAKHDLTDLLS